MSAKKILVHACCAPCLIAPLKELKRDWDVTAIWYNPNIHPYTEYVKRRDTLKDFAESEKLPVIWQDEYDLEMYLKATGALNNDRCRSCYEMRLLRVAQVAMGQGFDAFTTTLLYSRYQQHEEIRNVGEELATRFGIDFHYADWRPLWNEGKTLSIEAGLYRQKYCGCIFSEQRRYLKNGLTGS
jgi:predicted adenine nucleotide alpha hydrolase (AANH) superfamily ATPase